MHVCIHWYIYKCTYTYINIHICIYTMYMNRSLFPMAPLYPQKSLENLIQMVSCTLLADGKKLLPVYGYRNPVDQVNFQSIIST